MTQSVVRNPRMHMKSVPVPSAPVLQWLAAILGFVFLCVAAFLWSPIAGFGSIGLSLIVLAFMSAFSERA